ncbi:MAG: HAD family hydrolase [Metallosphaera sp.]
MIAYLVDLDVVFDFSTIKEMAELRKVTVSLSGVRYYPIEKLMKPILKDHDLLKEVEPFPDSLYLEDLSYRTRLFLVTDLPKLLAKTLLMKHNLDVFVQDVISSEDANAYLPSKQFFDFSAKRANTVLGVTNFVTSNLEYALPASLMMRVTLVRNDTYLPPDINILRKRDLISIAESLAQHKVDSTMGDSALRCT